MPKRTRARGESATEQNELLEEPTVKTRLSFLTLLLMIAWLVLALVRVENQRYALQLGMCRDEARKLPDLSCIERSETRTGWYWHLYFALKG